MPVLAVFDAQGGWRDTHVCDGWITEHLAVQGVSWGRGRKKGQRVLDSAGLFYLPTDDGYIGLLLEAAQLPRSLGDTEYAIVNGNFAISSGLKLTEAVVLEKTPDYYLNVVAVKTADKNTQWAKDIAEAYRSKEFKAVVDSKFQGYAKPSFLQ